MKQPKPVKAWGWAIDMTGEGDWELCVWASPSRLDLDRDGKPSPEARKVRVEIRPVPKKRRKARKAKR